MCLYAGMQSCLDSIQLLAILNSIYRVEPGIDQAREMGVSLSALENGAAVFPAPYLPLLLHFLLGTKTSVNHELGI